MKLIVCLLTNPLVFKIKQIVGLNGQIKSDWLISLMVIILLMVKIERAFDFTVMCAIRFQLITFIRCQHSKMVHQILFFKKMVHGPKKVENH